MQRFNSKSPRRAPRMLAVAAALALVATPPAHAQFFSSSGSNISYPVNLFPINPNAPSLDFTGNTVSIGNPAAGSFAAMAGALLKADALSIGDSGTGNGSVTVSGPGTSTLLGGATVNRLQVGNWGTGSMTVSAGAVVDATVNAAACTAPGAWCYSFIGNGAGSTGTLTVTGAGSRVSLLRSFGVGQTAVFTQANDGFTFGTPGGTTNAYVNVLNGGTLSTQTVMVGRGPTNAGATGTERGFGTVVIDGTGSRWIATRNTVDNTAAYFAAGLGVGGHATIDVRNGGSLVVDGTGGSASSYDALIVGANGGRGDLTVTGVGSSVSVAGNNAFLGVGRSGATAQGSFSVLAGATGSAMFMNVGRDGATGSVLIDGAGSRLNLTGVFTPDVGGGATFSSIGRGGGTGAVTVSNGGYLFISDGGGDSRNGNGDPGMAIGRDAGSSGKLTITGPGSMVEIVSTSLGVPAGSADNFNPFVGVGFDNAGSVPGQLMISNGGKLLLTGNAVSNPTYGRVTSVQIGGRGSGSGSGTATVTGAGSQIAVGGYDSFIGVGRGVGSSGTLNVLDHALVSTTSFLIGERASGTVNLDNAQLALSGYRTDGSNVGAGMTVGRGVGGNGVLAMTNGASLTIVNNTLAGGLSIGGDQFVAGGTGSVSLSGGSSITFGGSVASGALTVGRNGTGTLTLDGASTIDVGDTRAVFVGRNAGGIGNLAVSGGANVMGGIIGIGGDSDSVAGGNGSASVTGAGSELRASGATGFMSVGRSGTGSLSVSNQGAVSSTILDIGRAAGGLGSLLVDNALVNLTGQQTTGNLSGATLAIGNGGGTGTASINNGSVVTITNMGSSGVGLNIGGGPLYPLGSGTLDVSHSQINLVAAPGLATARVGHDGNGTATFTASSLNLGDGSLIVAGQPGSTGVLSLNAGSVVNAGYVGVGATQNGPGGAGHLILNNSTINTTTFELGALGVLSGDGGVINATGGVIVGGTISPGNSPGRININCDLTTLAGSKLILDVLGAGGAYNVDHLILGNDATFDLSRLQVIFNFLGNTDPTAFAASGGFMLDNFLESLNLRTGVVTGLSSVFAPGQTWSDIFTASQFTARSDAYVITDLHFSPDGSAAFSAAAIPEPATWAFMFVGLAVISGLGRRRSARPPESHRVGERRLPQT